MGRSALRRRVARAFAPAHVTGFFVPEIGNADPRGRGSLGAGVVLDRGVRATATWSPEGPRRLAVRRDPGGPAPISREVARRLRRDRPGSLEVVVEDQLPVGQGLGMSAAASVATALAVGELFDIPRGDRWQTAHLVDLTLRGGLGGVAAIGGGGLESRRRPGVPPWGRVEHQRLAADVFLLAAGPPIPSPTVLGDPARIVRIRRAGRAAWRAWRPRPGLDAFRAISREFTDRVGLASPELTRTLEALDRRGVPAAQAMFGRLVFGVVRPGERAAAKAAVGANALWVGVGTRGAHVEARTSGS